MDSVLNPFSPGAGTRPPALVGRDKQLKEIDVALRRLLAGKDGRGQLLTGLRGVGKTVLLNEFERIAEKLECVHAHIEVQEDGKLDGLIAVALRRVLLEMDAKKRLGKNLRRALGILKAFSVKLPDGPEFGVDIDAVLGPADSGNRAQDLAALFVEVGELAKRNGTAVLITIDELQYVSEEVLAALVIGVHRANQKGLPVLVAGAGLPSLPALAGEAKSYAERMFVFAVIGSLDRADATRALSEPVAKAGVRWHPDALNLLLTRTEGYPYFIQEFGKQSWDVAKGPTELTKSDVTRALDLAIDELDNGFFEVRTGRLSPQEQKYLRAMAELGKGPVKSAEVARLFGKTTTAMGPVRDRLVKKALIYMPKWGDLAFTVPLFDQFMKRRVPWSPTVSQTVRSSSAARPKRGRAQSRAVRDGRRAKASAVCG